MPVKSTEGPEWPCHHGVQWWPLQHSRTLECISCEFPTPPLHQNLTSLWSPQYAFPEYLYLSLLTSVVPLTAWNQRNPHTCHGPPIISFGFQGQSMEKDVLSIFSHMESLTFSPLHGAGTEVPEITQSPTNVLYLLKGRQTRTQNWTPAPRGSRLHSWREQGSWVYKALLLKSGQWVIQRNTWLKEFTQKEILFYSKHM